MKQEDKDLLLRDLCARLSYGVKLQNINNIESTIKLRSIDLDDYCCGILFYTYQGESLTICDKSKLFRFGKILRYKPYLFPLSSMTEEQYESLRESGILSNCSHSYEYVNPHIHGISFIFKKFKTYSLELIEWLNKNHFDYRGLIEKGLAIDATGLSIY